MAQLRQNLILPFFPGLSPLTQDISLLLALRSMSERLKILTGIGNTLLICTIIRQGTGVRMSDYAPTWPHKPNEAACFSAAQCPQ